MLRRAAPVLLSAVLLSLAACSESGDSAAAAATSTAPSWDCSPTSNLSQAEWAKRCKGVDNSTAAPTYDTEGSVTTADGTFIQYPNGLRVEIASVKTNDPVSADSAASAGHADYTASLDVTLKFTNNGATAYALNKAADGINPQMTFGANQYSAIGWAALDDTLPNQLVPGTNATQTYEFSFPPSGVTDNLRLTVTPDANAFTTYTFTDVQTLLGP